MQSVRLSLGSGLGSSVAAEAQFLIVMSPLTWVVLVGMGLMPPLVVADQQESQAPGLRQFCKQAVITLSRAARTKMSSCASWKLIGRI